MRVAALLLLVACSRSTVLEDRRVIRSPHGFQTVSMLDGGRTGLYYDVGEEAGELRPEARRVVLLGMGGGEMLRAARRALPGAELIGVEADGDIAATAITEFRVRDFGVHVVVDDGREWLEERVPHSIDILLVDVFDDEVLPEAFREVSFYRAAWLALRRDGLLVQNVWPQELVSGVAENLLDAGFSYVHVRRLAEGNALVFADR